ncbi:MAG: HAD-IIIC family phosphatase [Acidobacteriota bacterium]
MIPLDEAAILKGIDEAPHMRAVLKDFLRELHAPLLSKGIGDPIQLLALGDCLMNEVRVFLPGLCRSAQINLDIRVLYFSARMGQGLSTDHVLRFINSEAVDMIALSFLSYEGLPLYTALLREADHLTDSEIVERAGAIVKLMDRFMAELRERTDAPFLVHNACGLPLDRFRKHIPILPPLSSGRLRVLNALNESIQELVEHTPNTLLIDEVGTVAEYGYRECSRSLMERRAYRQALFHTSRFGEYLAGVYGDILRSYRDLRKTKVLLVDFDHTLWEGVMADGAVRHDYERQELLKRLKDAGIILVAVSKNDPNNVRWDEMRLRPDDFVLLKIGWEPKVQTIQQSAQQLDLGLDSFVLIDDNPVERELVEKNLSTVRTLDANNTYTWRALQRMLSFPNTRDTEESRARTALYRAQAQRREAVSLAFDYPAAMALLQLQVSFGKATSRDLDRVTELIQRTNQFNTTTIRLGRAQIEELLQSPKHNVYVAELSDKFGRQGLVAVAIVQTKDDEKVFDSFVMSCRAMGFELERLMLRLVLDAESDGKPFVGRFLPTDRNTPASSLFPEAGFTKRSETEWVLEAHAPRPEKPSWFTVVNRPTGR